MNKKVFFIIVIMFIIFSGYGDNATYKLNTNKDPKSNIVIGIIYRTLV